MNKSVKNGQWKVDVNNKLSKLLRDSKKQVKSINY